jgi:RNA polymerase sigma factor (sigma-70 family)
MDMREDAELLREYVAAHSEAAFTELVNRHIGMVYSAALRQVGGDAHLAQDVTQSVFIDLSRKSGALCSHTSLTGWLYTSVRFAAAAARRSNQRREQRESEAQRMNEPGQEPVPDWETLGPILDKALHHLGSEDRHAILLRFLEGKTLAEVGRSLGLNENAARKRVERALEKLRNFFGRRGISVSTIVIGDTLKAKAIVAVPPGMAGAITAVSIATPPAIFPLIQIMAITKTQIGAGAVAAAMATAIFFQTQSVSRLRHENQSLRAQSAQLDLLRAENERLANVQVPQAGALAADQLRDLARLRAEVGRLKTQLAAAKQSQQNDAQNPHEPAAQSRLDPMEQEKELAIVRLNSAKQLMLPIIDYVEAHQGQFPTNLAQLGPNLPGMDDFTNRFEIVYQGIHDGITNPASAIIVREIQAQQALSGNWTRAYGFADGHSEVHSTSDGNFAPWEQQHLSAGIPQ